MSKKRSPDSAGGGGEESTSKKSRSAQYTANRAILRRWAIYESYISGRRVEVKDVTCPHGSGHIFVQYRTLTTGTTRSFASVLFFLALGLPNYIIENLK